jgi:hypothetical protein
MNCKQCGETLVSQDHGEYCEDCVCSECGNVLDSDNERGLGICEDCQEATEL